MMISGEPRSFSQKVALGYFLVQSCEHGCSLFIVLWMTCVYLTLIIILRFMEFNKVENKNFINVRRENTKPKFCECTKTTQELYILVQMRG